VPTFSPDGAEYFARVHRNGRREDQAFLPSELLYHRFRSDQEVAGNATPLTILPFVGTTGPSVNRSKYSEPHDVLEPDCCDGHDRSTHKVLEFRVADVPDELAVADGSGRVFRFRVKHVPEAECFAHSEIWCNRDGNIFNPVEVPPKTVRLKLRALIQQRSSIRSFTPLPPTDLQAPVAEKRIGMFTQLFERVKTLFIRFRR
jgi:hypothetical protein